MGCFSSKPSIDPPQDPPPTRVSQQTQSKGETLNFDRMTRLRLRLSHLLKDPNPTAVPAKPVHPDEPITAPNPPQLDRKPSQKPPSRSDRSKFPPLSPGISRAASALPFDSARRGDWPISERETSRKPLPEPGSSNHSSSSRHMSRSASMDTHNTRYRTSPAPPSSFGNGGRVDMDLESRAGPRADPRRVATTGNNPRSFRPTVREVLPDGFRYALRP
jgi:hypothetical protein